MDMQMHEAATVLPRQKRCFTRLRVGTDATAAGVVPGPLHQNW